MSVFEGVLREEIERLESNIFSYKQMLEKLPKGSIFIRKDYNSYFVYRKRREGKKIISEYLGPLDSLDAQDGINKYNEYRRIRNNIQLAQKELCELKKAIKIYDRKRTTS